MKIIENLESNLNFERLKEFDAQKTKVFKYIMYKKRTENEIRNKFKLTIEENLLDDIIDYLKETGYINDYNYIERFVNECIALKNLAKKWKII